MMCLEVKSSYDFILIQGSEIQCRDFEPVQRTSQARETPRSKEPIIGKSLEDTPLVITVKLNIISSKTR